MADWKCFLCAAAAIACLTASGFAQTATTTLRQTGNLLGANYSTSDSSHFVGVSVSPGAPLDPVLARGQDTYMVGWSVGTFEPPVTPPEQPARIIYTAVTAIVPASRIQASAGKLWLDLDITSPYVVSAMTYDCTPLGCSQSKPASFPLRGAFAWYTGIGSYSGTSGSQESRYVDPNCVTTQSFKGQRSSGSAVFAGTIGPVTVVPPGIGSNADMNLSKGILQVERICTPTPPPPPPPPPPMP